MSALKPCPFCGAGETQLRPNGRVWAGTKWGEPTSVSVYHWCPPVPRCRYWHLVYPPLQPQR